MIYERDDPAFPVVSENLGKCDGITKLQYVVTHMLQGMLANSNFEAYDSERMVEKAVELANAVLEST